jgi:hypothetical protein
MESMDYCMLKSNFKAFLFFMQVCHFIAKMRLKEL